MRRRSEVLVGLAVIAGVTLATIGCQSQREPSAEAAPTPSVSASAEPAPTSTPTTSPVSTPTKAPLPQGEPIQITITSGDGTVIMDAVLEPDVLEPDGRLVPPAGKAGWYADEAAGWADRKPGYPGPSVVSCHVSGPGNVPDVCIDLHLVKAGDIAVVKYDSGDQVSFRAATDAMAIDKDDAVDVQNNELAQRIWYGHGDRPVLRVGTCDASTNFVDGHYTGNWWVMFDEII